MSLYKNLFSISIDQIIFLKHLFKEFQTSTAAFYVNMLVIIFSKVCQKNSS